MIYHFYFFFREVYNSFNGKPINLYSEKEILTMKLGELSSNYVNEAKEMKKFFMQAVMNEDTIQYLDAQTLEALKSCLKFYDLTLELVATQAKTIDEMNSKLDRLLAK